MVKSLCIIFIGLSISACSQSPKEMGNKIIAHCENPDKIIMHKCLQDSIFVLDQILGRG